MMLNRNNVNLLGYLLIYPYIFDEKPLLLLTVSNVMDIQL